MSHCWFAVIAATQEMLLIAFASATVWRENNGIWNIHGWSANEYVVCWYSTSKKKTLVIHLIPFNDKKKKREKRKSVWAVPNSILRYTCICCVSSLVFGPNTSKLFTNLRRISFSVFCCFFLRLGIFYIVRAWIWAHNELNDIARKIHNLCDSIRRYEWTANCSPKIRWALARNPNIP